MPRPTVRRTCGTAIAASARLCIPMSSIDAEPLAQPREPFGVVDAEHRAHDDLERDLLCARAQSERLAHRPRRDLLFGDLAHHVAVALHPLAVEGGEHQLALAHVLGPSSSSTELRPISGSSGVAFASPA